MPPRFLVVSGLLHLCAAAQAALPPSPLNADEKAFHLLNRLSFGPRPGEVAALAKGGDAALEKWLGQQLRPPPLAPDSATVRLIGTLKALSLDTPQLLEGYKRLQAIIREQLGKGATSEDRKKLAREVGRDHRPERIAQELAAAKLIRAIESPNQLEEVLVDFWFNHFNIDSNKGREHWYLPAYVRDVIRPNVFGNFRAMLGAVASSPAMLFYLDNWTSTRDGFVPRGRRGGKRKKNTEMGGINENYARELMELHTLGVDGGYTQADIREVARALTGWTIDKPGRAPRFVFQADAHDDGAKTILGAVFPAGGGFADGNRVLDLVARHPSTARFIATKLARRFVADKPPKSLVDRVAKAFRDSDGDLPRTYAALFTSPEFWSKDAFRSKIKTPLEFVVSAVRALDGHVDADFDFPFAPLAELRKMGMPLYACMPPTGYKDTADAWVNPGALVERINFGMRLVRGRVRGITVHLENVGAGLSAQAGGDPEAVINHLDSLLFRNELRGGTKEIILSEVRSEQGELPNDSERAQLVMARIAGLLLGSPEFQRK